MIGTTHFTNALVERQHLAPTAVVRLGLPATAAVPPLEDWPDDLRMALAGRGYLSTWVKKRRDSADLGQVQGNRGRSSTTCLGAVHEQLDRESTRRLRRCSSIMPWKVAPFGQVIALRLLSDGKQRLDQFDSASDRVGRGRARLSS